MSRRYDCSVPEERVAGLRDAASCITRGELVVLPTDTLYGVAADAFTPSAVDRLLAAKGRGRDMPVPVLVGSVHTLDGLVDLPTAEVRALVDAFWPGALTLVVRHVPSLSWDLGDTRGTVAVRMPLHPVALELLAETGPLAVSSANRSGAAPPLLCAEAVAQLQDSISVYLDGGPAAEAPVPSTIVDLTGDVPRVLRDGAVPRAALLELLPGLAEPEEPVARA